MAKGLNTVDLIPDVANFMRDLDLTPMNDRIKEEYYKQGYGLNDFAPNLTAHVEGSKVLFQSSPYAFYMLYGRRAGKFPPISKIEEWCSYKGITFKSAPFLIARKIAREGTKGNNFIYQIIPELKDMIVEQIQNNIKNKMKI
ncbi:MAG: hypothetical protein MJ197_08635 [Bacteroidales bacterium]|nr:hypothetical protein [Bacteroidales bacterium]